MRWSNGTPRPPLPEPALVFSVHETIWDAIEGSVRE
jgi:hypothetical protein